MKAMIASRPWSRVDVRVYHRTRVHHGYLQTHDVLGWVLHAELTREQRRQQGRDVRSKLFPVREKKYLFSRPVGEYQVHGVDAWFDCLLIFRSSIKKCIVSLRVLRERILRKLVYVFAKQANIDGIVFNQ